MDARLNEEDHLKSNSSSGGSNGAILRELDETRPCADGGLCILAAYIKNCYAFLIESEEEAADCWRIGNTWLGTQVGSKNSL